MKLMLKERVKMDIKIMKGIVLVITGLFLLGMVPIGMNMNALSESVIQTSDTDFKSGTLSNLDVLSSGKIIINDTHFGKTGSIFGKNWHAESDQLAAYFGFSVASAGDVNGDGYDDLIVGAEGYDNNETNEGRAYLFLGSSTGFSTTADWTAESNQANAYFGGSVASAGDVNGDGYDDVIVGARRYTNGETNEGRAYLYLGSSTGLSTTEDWTGESNQASANFGISVASAGDVNGDGYDDVIVGASGYSNGETDEGRAYLYLGSSTGLSTSADWTAESNQTAAYFGYSVASAGDVNGDGYDDVVVGAINYNNGESGEGRTFLYLGSSTGLSVSADWTAESNQASAGFGVSVASAGDVNGDGYDDVVVGAKNYDNGESDEGRAYLYLGSKIGLSTTADWTAESNQTNAYFGCSVASAGDVNGDGYDDVIVGASDYYNSETYEVGAFLFQGSSNGLSITADWTAKHNNLGVRSFGVSVTGGSDVNGDGYDDVIVGDYGYSNGEGSEGGAFAYFGSLTGLTNFAEWTEESNQASASFGVSVASAGDVNGDGYDDVIVGASGYDNGENGEGRAFLYLGSITGVSTTADWTAESDQIAAYFGGSVASAGDVNGDGFDDVVVGAKNYDNGTTNEGRAFLYLGSSTGLSTSADWTAESNQGDANFGTVSSAGDVNGDGYDDVLVGAHNYDNGETNEGRAYLYLGSSTGLSTTADWTAEGNQGSANFADSLSSAGDVNRDGYNDVIVGAKNYDNGELNEGRAFLYYGSSKGLSTTADWTAEGNQGGAHFGVDVNAGDFNGDGFDDVIVGANDYNNGEMLEGSVFLYMGSSTGPSTTPDWTAESNQAYANFGISVATAGDVNGDGYDDVFVGANEYDNGESDEGGSFLYLGSSTGPSTSVDWIAESNQVGANFGKSVGGASDVNGDGYDDLIVGAYSYKNGESGEGRAYIYTGNWYHSGVYTSKIFSVSNAQNIAWRSLSWNLEQEHQMDTLKFRVAVSDDGKNWNFKGPDNSKSSYFTTSGGEINMDMAKGKFFRYRAYFGTDGEKIPSLTDVTISYVTYDEPTIILYSPNGGEDLLKEEHHTITWESKGDLGSNPINLYYSTNGGKTWTIIANDFENNGTYNWTIPNIETATGLVKVTCEDIYENNISDVSDMTFAIDPPKEDIPKQEFQEVETPKIEPINDNNEIPEKNTINNENANLNSGVSVFLGFTGFLLIIFISILILKKKKINFKKIGDL